MERGLRRALATAVLLLALSTSGVMAQEWDPAAAIAAYSAALNAHDLPAALALFDQYGSATDVAGHHFEGGARLTEFLLASGFGSPDAHITTQNLHVVANRAVWIYSCSCATGSTEVRVVVNHARITVFFVIPPPAAPLPPSRGGGVPAWLVGLGVLLAGLAMWWGLSRGQSRALRPRVAHGQLLAALLESRTGGRGSHIP